MIGIGKILAAPMTVAFLFSVYHFIQYKAKLNDNSIRGYIVERHNRLTIHFGSIAIAILTLIVMLIVGGENM